MCFIHSVVSASQAFVCRFGEECLCEACPKFIPIQSCFPTLKFAWPVVQTVKNSGIDLISLLTRCDMDNWGSCVAECAKTKLKIQWCPPLPPLANTPRPLRQLCLGLLPPEGRLVALCCCCPTCDTAVWDVPAKAVSSWPQGNQPLVSFPTCWPGETQLDIPPPPVMGRGDQEKRKGW